jgi:cellulose biosynthesis protein BcsQ
MRDPSVFAQDFSADPYWWIAAPRPQEEPPPLPARVDVAIVGSGFTGLSAAVKLAKAGRSVVVLDQGDAGTGASARNMGFIGRVMKHELSEVIAMFGLERAVALYRETRNAFESVTSMVQDEAIDCNMPFFKSRSKIETLAYMLENYGKQNNIEYIVIDLPTQRNRLSEAVMPVSDYIIAPIRLDFFAQRLVDPTQAYVAKCVSRYGDSECKFLGFVFNVHGQSSLADEFIREQSDEIALLITMQMVNGGEFLFDGDENFASEVKFLLKDIEKKAVAPVKRKARDEDSDDDVIVEEAEASTSSKINFFPTGKRARN